MENRYTLLKFTVGRLQKAYHFDDAPEVSDEVYDALVAELQELENALGIPKEERVSQNIGHLE